MQLERNNINNNSCKKFNPNNRKKERKREWNE